jgi:predicted transcriptional regulator YheO
MCHYLNSEENKTQKENKKMARVSMVTRTMETTKVNVLCLNVETAEPFNKDIVLAGTFKDAKALKKAVEKAVDNDTEKSVHVVYSETVQTLYGMTEDEFIQHARVLPPRATAEATEQQ